MEGPGTESSSRDQRFQLLGASKISKCFNNTVLEMLLALHQHLNQVNMSTSFWEKSVPSWMARHWMSMLSILDWNFPPKHKCKLCRNRVADSMFTMVFFRNTEILENHKCWSIWSLEDHPFPLILGFSPKLKDVGWPFFVTV